MNDIQTYQVRLRGCLSESDLRVIQLLQIFDLRSGAESTSFSVSTDQSGLMGFLRQLHARGLALISIQCEEPTNQE